ncbi:PqqD family protein [Priestia megaterium]|uniref:PqqD family protein n=1 Tax=Priestia megaterium TaxID=1404 RepID=UPI001867729D|nr:PqqD family protein [Priestia megaterium]MBE2975835.1 PqqD family protein [Priestia megaterium]
MKQFVRNQDMEAVQLDSEWVILNTEAYTVTKINELGGYCWSLLESPCTILSLIKSLQTDYQIEDELSFEDMESFLSELVKYGLIDHVN